MLNQEILNYVIIRKIGDGGMGSVYLAKNKSIHQFVAIKMLHPQYSNNPLLRERFRNEAIMLSSLNHPNIVKFLNYVENDQGIFLIMEYVDGMTLEDHINKKSGLIVEERAYPMFRQILDAFSYAHKHQIVHRDIKPSNILIDRDGNIKILDFGIAQILSETNDSGIKGGGTASYMSPEQVHDRPLDPRSDIYSLGVVFYQMLTGKPPYDLTALSPFDIKQKVLSEPLPPMRETYPYVAEELQGIINKAMGKEPVSRYQNCNEMKKDVVRAHKAIQAREGGGSSGGFGEKKGPKPWIIILAAVLAVLIAGGGVLFFLFKTSDGKYYYSDYVEKKGVPEGVNKLSDKDKEGLESFYRVEYLNGKIVRISLVNSKDSVVAVSDSLLALVKYPDVRFKYNDKGNITNKEIYNEKGELQFKLSYKDDGKKATLTPEGSNHPANGIFYGTPTQKEYVLEYDGKTGTLSEIKFVDESGFPTQNNDSIAAMTFTYGKNGQIERMNYVDKLGSPKDNSYKFAIAEFKYDDKGNFVSSKSYNKNGTTVTPEKSGNKSNPVPAKKTKASKKKLAENTKTKNTAPSSKQKMVSTTNTSSSDKSWMKQVLNTEDY